MLKKFLLGAAALALVSSANAAAVDSSHFTPTTVCQTLSVSGVPSRLQLLSNDPTIVIFNTDATNTAYVLFGNSTVASDILEYPVAPSAANAPVVLTQKQSNKATGNPWISAVTASSTAGLKICQGQGGSPN